MRGIGVLRALPGWVAHCSGARPFIRNASRNGGHAGAVSKSRAQSCGGLLRCTLLRSVTHAELFSMRPGSVAGAAWICTALAKQTAKRRPTWGIGGGAAAVCMGCLIRQFWPLYVQRDVRHPGARVLPARPLRGVHAPPDAGREHPRTAHGLSAGPVPLRGGRSARQVARMATACKPIAPSRARPGAAVHQKEGRQGEQRSQEAG